MLRACRFAGEALDALGGFATGGRLEPEPVLAVIHPVHARSVKGLHDLGDLDVHRAALHAVLAVRARIVEQLVELFLRQTQSSSSESGM